MKEISRGIISFYIADRVSELGEGYTGDSSYAYFTNDTVKEATREWSIWPLTLQNITLFRYLLPAPTIQEFRSWLSEKWGYSYILELDSLSGGFKCSSVSSMLSKGATPVNSCYVGAIWKFEEDAHHDILREILNHIKESINKS